ncbi:unnamed protein product, partial [Brenthis ino]
MADIESDGKMYEREDTLSGEADQKGLEQTVETWKDQYIQSILKPNCPRCYVRQRMRNLMMKQLVILSDFDQRLDEVQNLSTEALHSLLEGEPDLSLIQDTTTSQDVTMAEVHEEAICSIPEISVAASTSTSLPLPEVTVSDEQNTAQTTLSFSRDTFRPLQDKSRNWSFIHENGTWPSFDREMQVKKRKPEDEVSAVYNGPYKLIAYHQGTRRWHWNLIYISHNKQWGFNSRLGRIIREGTYKTTSINCLSSLREYLNSGNGCPVLQDILSDEHIETSKKNVKNLLIKQFGENWESLPELEWYKRLLCETVPTLSQNQEEKDDDEECDCFEPDTDTLRV